MDCASQKPLQCAISKFAIYLGDLENFGKKEKSENKDRNFWLCQKISRSSITTWDEVLFASVDAVERTFVGLAEEVGYSC